jgi:hypothetical protein
VLGRDPHQFGVAHNRWRLADVPRACPWLRLTSVPGVSRLLRRLRMHLKRGQGHVTSPDPHYRAKLVTVRLALASSQAGPEREVVLFQDEFSYTRHPSLAPAYAPVGRRQPRTELGWRTNRMGRVVATLDAWTGRIIFAQYPRITVAHLVKFYQVVCQGYPDARRIWLIQDNWPVHYHPDVLAALQPLAEDWPRHPPRTWPTEPSRAARPLHLPITPLRLPSYASWTNPIEKVWRKLRQDELHLHRFGDDWAGLTERVAAFLGQYAQGSAELLRYVGLANPLALYHAALASSTTEGVITVSNC